MKSTMSCSDRGKCQLSKIHEILILVRYSSKQTPIHPIQSHEIDKTK